MGKKEKFRCFIERKRLFFFERMPLKKKQKNKKTIEKKPKALKNENFQTYY
jgi:hypothetical protein